MRLDAESEGNKIFSVDTLQEELDKEKLRNSVVLELSQGKPVALSFKDIGISPEKFVASFRTEFIDYLENRGFKPKIAIKNNQGEQGDIPKYVLLIEHRR